MAASAFALLSAAGETDGLPTQPTPIDASGSSGCGVFCWLSMQACTCKGIYCTVCAHMCLQRFGFFFLRRRPMAQDERGVPQPPASLAQGKNGSFRWALETCRTCGAVLHASKMYMRAPCQPANVQLPYNYASLRVYVCELPVVVG